VLATDFVILKGPTSPLGTLASVVSTGANRITVRICNITANALDPDTIVGLTFVTIHSP
jgi:hypothetical protein